MNKITKYFEKGNGQEGNKPQAVTRRSIASEKTVFLDNLTRSPERDTDSECFKENADEFTLAKGTIQGSICYTMFTDGACLPNPGTCGVGYVVYNPEGVEIYTNSLHIGTGTNNTSEYLGVVFGLRSAINLGIRRIEVMCDAELVVKQVNNKERVVDGKMKVLYNKVHELLKQFDYATINWIPREANVRADGLAKRGKGKGMMKVPEIANRSNQMSESRPTTLNTNIINGNKELGSSASRDNSHKSNNNYSETDLKEIDKMLEDSNKPKSKRGRPKKNNNVNSQQSTPNKKLDFSFANMNIEVEGQINVTQLANDTIHELEQMLGAASQPNEYENMNPNEPLVGGEEIQDGKSYSIAPQGENRYEQGMNGYLPGPSLPIEQFSNHTDFPPQGSLVVNEIECALSHCQNGEKANQQNEIMTRVQGMGRAVDCMERHLSGQENKLSAMMLFNNQIVSKTRELDNTMKQLLQYGNELLEPWRENVSNILSSILDSSKNLENIVSVTITDYQELNRRVNILGDELYILKQSKEELEQRVFNQECLHEISACGLDKQNERNHENGRSQQEKIAEIIDEFKQEWNRCKIEEQQFWYNKLENLKSEAQADHQKLQSLIDQRSHEIKDLSNRIENMNIEKHFSSEDPVDSNIKIDRAKRNVIHGGLDAIKNMTSNEKLSHDRIRRGDWRHKAIERLILNPGKLDTKSANGKTVLFEFTVGREKIYYDVERINHIKEHHQKRMYKHNDRPLVINDENNFREYEEGFAYSLNH